MRITKPRTQRRRLFQSPAHRRHKEFSAPLADDLKNKHGFNAVPVKTGDTVRIMRGDRKGFEGKIIRVDRQKYRIFVEGVTREKVDGTAMPIPLHPSKVMIINLDLDDKWRRKAIKRKGEPKEEIPTVITEKPEEKQGAEKPQRRKRKTHVKRARRKEKIAEKPQKPLTGRKKRMKKSKSGKRGE